MWKNEKISSSLKNLTSDLCFTINQFWATATNTQAGLKIDMPPYYTWEFFLWSSLYSRGSCFHVSKCAFPLQQTLSEGSSMKFTVLTPCTHKLHQVELYTCITSLGICFLETWNIGWKTNLKRAAHNCKWKPYPGENCSLSSLVSSCTAKLSCRNGSLELKSWFMIKATIFSGCGKWLRPLLQSKKEDSWYGTAGLEFWLIFLLD